MPPLNLDLYIWRQVAEVAAIGALALVLLGLGIGFGYLLGRRGA